MAVEAEIVVAGGPHGDVRFALALGDDGSLVDRDVPTGEPDVTLTVPHADAQAIAAGHGSLNASFISGRTKVAGHTGRLFDVLAATDGEGYESFRAVLSARADV